MTDREYLEFAAKAAGLEVVGEEHPPDGLNVRMGSLVAVWRPFADDGDALRLAVKLGLTITPNYHVEQRGLEVIAFTELTDSEDFCTATRRAIVRAAAEIGRNMK